MLVVLGPGARRRTCRGSATAGMTSAGGWGAPGTATELHQSTRLPRCIRCRVSSRTIGRPQAGRSIRDPGTARAVLVVLGPGALRRTCRGGVTRNTGDSHHFPQHGSDLSPARQRTSVVVPVLPYPSMFVSAHTASAWPETARARGEAVKTTISAICCGVTYSLIDWNCIM